MWIARASLSFLASLLAIGAVVVASHVADAAAEPSGVQDAIHQVLPGDDLHLIAGYYYGDARQWERIWDANRDQIRNPNVIERGALLRIPDAAAPAQPYPDFVARTRPAQPGPGEARSGPAAAQPAAPPAPQVEVRIMGEEQPARGTPGEAPATAPEASAPPRVVGAPGTLPPRPIPIPGTKAPGREGS
jgi:hypothetical protein